MNCVRHPEKQPRKSCSCCGHHLCGGCVTSYRGRAFCSKKCQKRFLHKSYLHDLSAYIFWRLSRLFVIHAITPFFSILLDLIRVLRATARRLPSSLGGFLSNRTFDIYLEWVRLSYLRARSSTAKEERRPLISRAQLRNAAIFSAASLAAIYLITNINTSNLRKTAPPELTKTLAAKVSRAPEDSKILVAKAKPLLKSPIKTSSAPKPKLKAVKNEPGLKRYTSINIEMNRELRPYLNLNKITAKSASNVKVKPEKIVQLRVNSDPIPEKRLKSRPEVKVTALPKTAKIIKAETKEARKAEIEALTKRALEQETKRTKSEPLKEKVPILREKAKGTITASLSTKIKTKPTKKKLLNLSRGRLELKELAITFDANNKTDHTIEILDTLKKRGIKTTIFLTGNFIKNNPEMVLRILSDGHEVGNHLLNHPHLTDYSKTFRHRTLPHVDRAFLVGEITETARIFKQVTGQDISPYWRAPYGEINAEITGWAKEAGFMHVGWTMDPKTRTSLDTLDWVKDKNSKLYLSANEIKDKILNFDSSGAGLNGGIILMHLSTDRRKDRASTMLGELLDDITAKGFSFIKVSTMYKTLNRRGLAGKQLAFKSAGLKK